MEIGKPVFVAGAPARRLVGPGHQDAGGNKLAEPVGQYGIRHAQVVALALRVAARTITSSCVHRAATCQFWPDGLTWTRWAEETTEMAVAYLTTPQRTTHQ